MVQHVHIKCDPNFINYLFGLAEPELNGDTQEKHAKNIEIAKKEVLTCIGITLFDRSVMVSAANRLIGEVVQSRRRPLLGPSPG